MSVEIIHTCDRCGQKTRLSRPEAAYGPKSKSDPLGQNTRSLCDPCQQIKNEIMEALGAFTMTCLKAWEDGKSQPYPPKFWK